MKLNEIKPGADLYNQVRAGFILQGSNLSTWCKSEGVHPTNAKGCLVGMWNGPKGELLREKILVACGILDSSSCESADQHKPDSTENTEAEEFFYWGC